MIPPLQDRVAEAGSFVHVNCGRASSSSSLLLLRSCSHQFYLRVMKIKISSGSFEGAAVVSTVVLLD